MKDIFVEKDDSVKKRSLSHPSDQDQICTRMTQTTIIMDSRVEGGKFCLGGSMVRIKPDRR